MYKKYFIFLILTVTLCLYNIHFAGANSEASPKIINKNFQDFLSLKRFSPITDLYNSGDLKFEIISPEDFKIIKRWDKLVFWHAIDAKNSSWELIISLWERKRSIPLELQIQRDTEDFSIADDMFQLSLQEKTLSCESSAAADIISSYFWRSLHEDEIIDILPKDPHYNMLPEEHPENITIWWNPNAWFVGYIDSTKDIIAKQKLMTGYGVYEQPLTQVYKKYWLQTQILNNSHYSNSFTSHVHLRYILEKLKRWYMVQLWWDWCTRDEYDDGVLESKKDFYNRNIWLSINAKNTCYNVNEPRELKWKYYNEKGELTDHIWLDGEHAFILLGWKWNISNPSHIRVWDTDTGYHEYPTKEWMRKWKRMDYRSLIISR